MSKVVVGLYDQFEDARRAVEELVQNGFQRDNISLIANNARGEFKDYTGDEETGKEVGESAAGGAGIGAVVGGLGGLLAGLGLLTIPGIGPVLAAGPLVSALAGAGIGAAAGGLIGGLIELGIPDDKAKTYEEGVRRGGTLVTVTAPDPMANRAVDIMNRHNPVDVERRQQEWQGAGRDTQDPYARASHAEMRAHDRQRVEGESEENLPIIEEEMRVGKRQVEAGGVRIHTYVSEKPVEETVNLRDEHVDVERHRVDRPARPEDLDTFREGTIDITESHEEAVTDKSARVVEEVSIHKNVDEHQETIRDTVRRTEVEVEDLQGRSKRDPGTANLDEYDQYFRGHYNSNYSNTSYTYDQYRPYYAYGYELAEADRYRGRNWNEVETEARRDWEQNNTGGLWDDFKEAVRAGWEAARGRR